MNAQDKKVALKITNKLEKFVQRLKVVAGIVILVIIVMLMGLGGHTVYRFVNDNNFLWRSPIELKLQAPLQIVEKRPVTLEKVQKSLESQNTSKFKVSAQEIAGKNENGIITAGESLDEKIERAYQTIHLHETGNGSNKSGLNGLCISRGMINEVGFDMSGSTCFKDQQEQHDTVVLWFKNRLNKVKTPHCDTVEACLAIYNSNSYTL